MAKKIEYFDVDKEMKWYKIDKDWRPEKVSKTNHQEIFRFRNNKNKKHFNCEIQHA